MCVCVCSGSVELYLTVSGDYPPAELLIVCLTVKQLELSVRRTEEEMVGEEANVVSEGLADCGSYMSAGGLVIVLDNSLQF